jgi:hypothetical protein
LTDQIRRLQSVPATMLKHIERGFIKTFYSKVDRILMEKIQKLICLEFALSCKYISEAIYQEFLKV